MINNSISDRLVGALSNALIHSLWQGILLAAIAGLIVICTRRASSALRYNLLVSALILFAVGVSATFVEQYHTFVGQYPTSRDAAVPEHIAQSYHGGNPVLPGDPGLQPAVTASKPGFTDLISTWLNDHHNTIVFVWFLIICARCLQLGVGLYGTYRLRRVRVTAVTNQWSERMLQLAVALNIRQTIALLESGLAKVPMMIGHLKPVILVPVGLLTALSPAEVEAILIHELAHIRRRDYLVNMLQNLMEIVFFFNPAVLWVSTLIRTERENCCDDLALAHDNNKANYIRALVSCEEYQSSVPPYALAFPGAKNTLLHRVKRLASNRNHSLNLFEKTVLTVCLVGAGLFVTAFSAKEVSAHPALLSSTSSPVLHPEKTIVEKTRSTIARSMAKRENPKPEYPQPERTQPPATQPIQPTETAVHPAETVAQPKHDTAANPVIPDLGDTLVKYNIIPVKINMTAKLNSSELSINGVKQPEAVRSLVYSKFLNDNVHTVDIDYVYKNTQPDNYNRKPYNSKPYASYGGRYDDPARQALDREQQALDREQQALDRERQALDRRRNYPSDEAAIKLDLIKEGLVSDTNHIYFKINGTEFILNGVRQSQEVYQRYMDKYGPTYGDPANWSWSHSTGMPEPRKNN
jgi:bla regulator protein blaR1